MNKKVNDQTKIRSWKKALLIAAAPIAFALHVHNGFAMQNIQQELTDQGQPSVRPFLFQGRLNHSIHPFDLPNDRAYQPTVYLSATPTKTPEDFMRENDQREYSYIKENVRQYFIDNFPDLDCLSALNMQPFPRNINVPTGLSFHFTNTTANITTQDFQRVLSAFENFGLPEGFGDGSPHFYVKHLDFMLHDPYPQNRQTVSDIIAEIARIIQTRGCRNLESFSLRFMSLCQNNVQKIINAFDSETNAKSLELLIFSFNSLDSDQEGLTDTLLGQGGLILNLIKNPDFKKLKFVDLSGNNKIIVQEPGLLHTAILRRKNILRLNNNGDNMKIRLNFSGLTQSRLNQYTFDRLRQGPLLILETSDSTLDQLNDLRSLWRENNDNNPIKLSKLIKEGSSFQASMDIAHSLAFTRAQRAPVLSLEGGQLEFLSAYYLIDYHKLKEGTGCLNLCRAFREEPIISPHSLLGNQLSKYNNLRIVSFADNRWTAEILQHYVKSLENSTSVIQLNLENNRFGSGIANDQSQAVGKTVDSLLLLSSEAPLIDVVFSHNKTVADVDFGSLLSIWQDAPHLMRINLSGNLLTLAREEDRENFISAANHLAKHSNKKASFINLSHNHISQNNMQIFIEKYKESIQENPDLNWPIVRINSVDSNPDNVTEIGGARTFLEWKKIYEQSPQHEEEWGVWKDLIKQDIPLSRIYHEKAVELQLKNLSRGFLNNCRNIIDAVPFGMLNDDPFRNFSPASWGELVGRPELLREVERLLIKYNVPALQEEKIKRAKLLTNRDQLGLNERANQCRYFKTLHENEQQGRVFEAMNILYRLRNGVPSNDIILDSILLNTLR